MNSLPQVAEIIERVEESPSIFTLRLRLQDDAIRRDYCFQPGQFNMLYLFGVGEVPISIISDPRDQQLLDHTIRNVGRVTQGLARLQAGDQMGLRGPFGRGWPMQQARGHDVLIITGGLGCAPTVSVIRYILRRRQQYGHLSIVQGVKHSCDMIWSAQYSQWAASADTEVHIAADYSEAGWPWHRGQATELLRDVTLDPARSLCMLCGPEAMMKVASQQLLARGVDAGSIYMSMERNMHCGIGRCGHCQYGAHFVCRDGPVFALQEIQGLLGRRGF